jgi:hypothetical protein
MAQSRKGVSAAIFSDATSLYANQTGPDGSAVLVTYGPPGINQPAAIVAVMGSRNPVARPTMGTNRSRESTTEVDVVISVWVPGEENVQQIASEACHDLVDLFEAYVRTTDTTLGGACRDAWVSNIEGPNPDISTDAQSGAATGRIAEATITVTAAIRY